MQEQRFFIIFIFESTIKPTATTPTPEVFSKAAREVAADVVAKTKFFTPAVASIGTKHKK